MVQQFLRGSCASSPSTNARALRRGSTLRKRPPDPHHQVIKYPRPLARVYAVASGHQKIITSCHKPGSSDGGRPGSQHQHAEDHDLQPER
jgi:hypothetical protein